MFVGLAYGGTNHVMTSPVCFHLSLDSLSEFTYRTIIFQDGLDWTMQATVADGYKWSAMEFGGGRFVGIGDSSQSITSLVNRPPLKLLRISKANDSSLSPLGWHQMDVA